MCLDFGGTLIIDNSITLTLAGENDGLISMKFFSGDGTINILGEYDNFNAGYKSTLNYSN